MAINIIPGFRMQARILALLQDRPMMAVEITVRLRDYPYRSIADLRMIGQRYALAWSEADGPPAA